MSSHSFADQVSNLNEELNDSKKKFLETNRFNKFIPSSYPIAISLKIEKPLVEI